MNEKKKCCAAERSLARRLGERRAKPLQRLTPPPHWQTSRSTVSLSVATAVASALRYGIDHLSKGPADPAGAGDHSDSDADASDSE